MISRASAVGFVLNADAPSDLAARYSPGMEVQVNVDPADGEQVFKEMRPTPMYSKDGTTWYNYRIDSREDADKNQTFNLLGHYDSIGISGHDPTRQVSIGVGFDFDSIVGHKAGLSQERLDALLAALMHLPYVEVRKSTGGGGYHIWVWFDPENLPATANRAEHKALARAVLQKMSLDAGHDLEADIDCYGAILWICARRATAENGGLSLVRPALGPLTDYPANWRDHLDVISGKRRRTKLHASLSSAEAEQIDAEYQDAPRGLLDDDHRTFIERHQELGFSTSWNQDLGCLSGHTAAIKLIQQTYGLKGIFETISDGTEPTKPNCFMYPGLDGSWRVFRFNKDAEEAKTWEKSANGWTTCVINEPVTLAKAAAAYGGLPSPQRKGEAHLFRDVDAVKSVIGAMSGSVVIPEFLVGRQYTIRTLNADSVAVETDHHDGDDQKADLAWDAGWSKDRKIWGVVVKVEAQSMGREKLPQTDSLARHVAQHGKQVALYANSVSGWQQQGNDQVRNYLLHRGVDRPTVPYVLGWCAAHPWELVAIPFEDEYPGRRRWNRDGAKLLYRPSDRPGATPFWDRVLDHIGRGLDDAVESDAWCQSHGMKTGADYLKHWIAIMLRTPSRRLPLLFLYSCPEQNTGKSVLHEGLSQLFDENGFTFADKALTLASGFNAELRGKALCVVEETNLAKSELAYTRLKAWVTGPNLQISPKGKDSFVEENFTHWMMTANNIEHLPIEPGDTRIVMWEVTPYEGQEIPKDQLLAELRKEAPHFLYELYALDISDSAGRHTLPVLMTAEKAERVQCVEGLAKYDGLPPVARKLCDAIIAMPKPFSGTATALDEALGSAWCEDVQGKEQRSRVTTIGRNMQRIGPTLQKHAITLAIDPGRVSTYHLAV